MFVINSEGKPIPLAYFAKWQPANAPLSVNHQGLSAASNKTNFITHGRGRRSLDSSHEIQNRI